jgi:hypothetical protein
LESQGVELRLVKQGKCDECEDEKPDGAEECEHAQSDGDDRRKVKGLTMALDALFKLDPVNPTSNSNFTGANISENCAPSGINNALRALGQMVAQQLCYQSAAISSSVSTNIATTSTGLLVPITGANAINSLGVVPGEQASAAVVRFLQFSSSASLSHGTALRLLGQASRKTQPGDIGGYIHVGSADVWHEFLWSRAADGDGNFASLSASIATFTTLNASSASISHVTATSISASVIRVAGQQEFPRYCFMAVNAGTQISITLTATQLTFAETFDVGGFFASNTWTPAAGKYRIQTHVTMDSLAVSDIASVAILEDGTSIAVSNAKSPVSSSQMTASIDLLIEANGTNAYTVTAWKAAAGNGVIVGGSTPRRTWFCGERI